MVIWGQLFPFLDLLVSKYLFTSNDGLHIIWIKFMGHDCIFEGWPVVSCIKMYHMFWSYLVSFTCVMWSISLVLPPTHTFCMYKHTYSKVNSCSIRIENSIKVLIFTFCFDALSVCKNSFPEVLLLVFIISFFFVSSCSCWRLNNTIPLVRWIVSLAHPSTVAKWGWHLELPSPQFLDQPLLLRKMYHMERGEQL